MSPVYTVTRAVEPLRNCTMLRMVHALDADKDHRQTCRARTRVFKEENITPKLGSFSQA